MPKKPIPPVERLRRDAEIARMHEAGSTVDDLAKQFHLSVYTVRNICVEQPRFHLTVRSHNALKLLCGDDNASPSTVAHFTKAQVAAVPNCGVKSVDEIEAWLAAAGFGFAPEPR